MRVLVVEDVCTTGGSTRETMQVATAAGGHVVGAASIVDRSGGTSEYAPFQKFRVAVPIDDPDVSVAGGGCQVGGSSRPGTGGLALLGLTLVGLLRRRRR